MINQNILRKLLTALILLMITMTIGVSGFHFVEGYSVLDAFYMTFITISTVGYEVLGENGLSDDGKIFVIFLIIFTIATFSYALTTVTTYLLEGEIRKIVKGYRVNTAINKLENHIVICGLGRNGQQAALELEHEGVPYVVIEHDEEVVESFVETRPDALVIRGDATDEETLALARLDRARGVISALADDASNVYVTLTIRQLNPTVQVVARAAHESTISKLQIAGANRVILPNMLGGRKMAKILTKPALMDFVDMITGQGQTHLNIEQVDCLHNPRLVGRTLRELDIRSRTGVLVLGMQDQQGNFQLNPEVNKVIKDDERLFIIGNDQQLKRFRLEFTS